MSESHERHSAQILPFPARPRRPARMTPSEGQISADIVSTPYFAAETTPLAQTACGSGWYHDEAIRETEPGRKP